MIKFKRYCLCCFLSIAVTSQNVYSGDSTDNPVKTLKSEPANMFDLGMHKLNNNFDMQRTFITKWFKKNHSNIEYVIDAATYKSPKNKIIITRFIRGIANYKNCTIAIETLSDKYFASGSYEFIRMYFWHYDSFNAPIPAWLTKLEENIYLSATVHNPNARENGVEFFECERRADKEEVKITKKILNK